MDEFFDRLNKIDDELVLLDFCRKYMLHGTPQVFAGKEDQYYEFRKRIADKFEVEFHEVFITGSGKLGFSPFKRKYFDYDSDIDIAILSSSLYDKIMDSIHYYQMQLRESRKAVTEFEIKKYHKFLEYAAIGWMRPDLLPFSFRVKKIKKEWFEFFDSLSNGKSEIGNYQVTAGVFKSYRYLEKYTFSGLQSLKKSLEILKLNG